MKLSEAQKRVLKWIGNGWSTGPGAGASVIVNGKRICNTDTMMALSRAGLVVKDDGAAGLRLEKVNRLLDNLDSKRKIMSMHVYVGKPLLYGLLFAAIYGLLVLLLSFPAIYGMIRPDVDFMYAWKGVFDVTASGIVGFGIFGFWQGWNSARNGKS